MHESNIGPFCYVKVKFDNSERRFWGQLGLEVAGRWQFGRREGAEIRGWSAFNVRCPLGARGIDGGQGSEGQICVENHWLKLASNATGRRSDEIGEAQRGGKKNAATEAAAF